MKGKFYTIVLVAVMAVALAACAGGGAPAQQAVATPAPTEAAMDLVTQAPPQETAVSTEQPTEAPQETAASGAGGGARTFVIDAAQSKAHFLINEVLFGSPKLVDGVTSLVEGQIVADYANPSDTTVGPIKVDLTGLTTDSSNRTGTLHRSILETGNPAFQFAEFTTTKLDGLPAAVTVGQPFSFKITGNLALHGVTKEVTFDATVTPVSETQLKGEASTTITYADWGVRILRLPQQVASVEDHTILKLEFVATAQ